MSRAVWTIVVALCVLGVGAPSALALPPDWERGANVTSWWHDDYEQPRAQQELAALASTGTTHVAVLATWYMDARDSSTIARDALKTPSDNGMRAIVAKARSLGMSVAIKPHVDVRDGTFRGDIAPADPGRWFADYRTMLDHYADLARETGADTLVVGTELTSMSGHADQWRGVIADVRARFTGRLTFAANWTDGARKVTFWPDLDAIGIDAYMPLAREPAASVDALAGAWCGHVREIAALHERYGKPVVLTELGYESRYGTATTPWGGATGAIAQEPQRRAYEAAFRVWSGVPWMKGIYWWDWPAAGSDASAGSYSPAGKSAQSTLAAWNTGAAPQAAQACNRSAAAVPEVKTVVTLRAHVRKKRRGARRVRLSGTLRREGNRCGAKVKVRVQRWSASRRRWRHGVRFTSGTRVGGHYRLERNLRHGRYRAHSRTAGKCGNARSRYERFKVR